GVIEESAGASPSQAQPVAKAAPAPAEAPRSEAAPAAPPSKPAAKPTRATPTARRAAEEHEVDLARVQGSGDAGRGMRRDVEQAAASAGTDGKSAAAAAAPARATAAPPVSELPRVPAGDRVDERIRMSKRRATIARRLVEAQSTAAMLSTFNEVDMTAVM